jgi:hypothetical protein
MKYHLRYFTIKSSLIPEPVSFLPQGEDVAITFRGSKAGELCYVYSSFAEEEITLFDSVRERFINLYSPFAEKGQKRLVISFGQKFDVQDYSIELDFQPQNLFLSAKARIGLLSRVDDLDAVRLKFNPALEILRIYDSERRELYFSQDRTGKVLYVYFLEPIPKNDKTFIEVFYRGKLEPPAQITDTVLGQQYDNMGSLLPPFQETYLFSQSAFWYPSPPDENYFTARIKIIVPPGFSCISNGLLLEQGTVNGVQRVTEIDKVGSAFSVFETNSPVKYLSFLVGKLTQTQESAGPIPLASYAASDVHTPKKNLLDEARRILDFYEKRFGAFPFDNLRVVQRQWPTSGGHSPASFVILNELPRSQPPSSMYIIKLIPNPTSPVDLPQWKEYFLAHEIAHQWWGQGVTWARYRDQWISEGLAQYASALYIQSKYGDDALSDIFKKFSMWTEKKSKWGPITLGSRLSFFDFYAYQTIVYDKTSLALNMLHDLLGEEIFFAGLRDFFETRKYSAATTGQFKNTMEKVSGRNLNIFFSLWFDSYLLPKVQVAHSLGKKDSGYVLKVKVDQLVDVFVFPLWIEWKDNNGVPHREKMVIEKQSQEYEFTLPGAVKNIRLNPDRTVPGKFHVIKG